MVRDDLSQATRLHESGQLERAASMYRSILVREPHHADALHLLGVVALQQGNPRRAGELIGRAVHLRPGMAQFHCHLAVAQNALGQPEQAAASCRTALRLSPNFPDAHNNLGMAHYVQGRLQEATASFREAIRLQPDLVSAHNNLGNVYRQLGQFDRAVQCWKDAVRLDPAMAEAHTNLGQVMLERRDLPAAMYHCATAVRLRPTLPQAQNNLGNVLREQGRLAEAKACYAEVLRMNPNIALTHNNMAQALQEEGQLEEAIHWYRRSLELDAKCARTHANLGSALVELDRCDEATAAYETALGLDPASVEAHHGLGQREQELGHRAAAQAHYLEAIRLKLDFVAVHCSLAKLHEEAGVFDKAEKCLREARRLGPSCPESLSQLANLLRGKLTEEDEASMRRLLDDPFAKSWRRAGLHFGLAQVLDARGDYAQAADNMDKANRILLADRAQRNRGYDADDHSRYVDELLAAFSPPFFEKMHGCGLETELPVFVFGLPRSGTTLVEQILASHDRIHGAGELRLARLSLDKARTRTGSSPGTSALAELSRDDLRDVAEEHVRDLRALSGGEPRVVDKMPENYLYLGLLAVMFPRARFIHCRRDLRDVAVSCWITNFAQIRWASDHVSLARRFRDYRRLVEHWRTTLPVRLLEIDYENTVADLEGTARKLIEWCGLEWQPSCLDFHKTERCVRTASSTQVRRPIYSSSVGRWRHYERELEPLFRILPS